MQQHSTLYTIFFAGVVCIICSLLVSSAAVGLKERQEENIALDMQQNVLLAAGLISPGQAPSRDEVKTLFSDVEKRCIDLKTGQYNDNLDPDQFDADKAFSDPEQSFQAPANFAQVPRLPNNPVVYHVMKNGKVDLLVLPIRGKGLWSTLKGFLAIDKDTTTIRGITYYQHGETPGLGGEVDNSKWKALWVGRKVYDENWNVKIEVIKGNAGPVGKDPHRVDGLSGATLTSRGVTNMLHLWLGENGYGPFLKKLRESA